MKSEQIWNFLKENEFLDNKGKVQDSLRQHFRNSSESAIRHIPVGCNNVALMAMIMLSLHGMRGLDPSESREDLYALALKTESGSQ